MADTKISALTQVTQPAMADELAANDIGNSKKITLSQLMVLQYVQITLTGSDRMTLAGTQETLVSDFGATAPIYAGWPKRGSFTVKDNYAYDLVGELSLWNADRVSLLGSADLILSDDFRQRNRLILS